MAPKASNSSRGSYQKSIIQVPAASGNGIYFDGYSTSSALVYANSTGLTIAGAVKLAAQANATLTGDSAGISIAGNLRVSGKSITLTANSTALISSGKVALSGQSGKTLGANSTCFLLATASAIPTTRQVGGLVFVSNSTGKMLAYHSTGTTWKYVDKTSVLA